MINTPFDLVLEEVYLKNRSSRGDNSKLILCETFIKVCIIRYKNMVESSRPWWNHLELLKQDIKSEVLSHDYINFSIKNTEAVNNYLDFIETLNRFGRAFSKIYRGSPELPNYPEIRFYRNKMIEHWDDYQEFLNSYSNAFVFYKDKLLIPSHFSGINRPADAPIIYGKLKDEFQLVGVSLPTLDLSDMYINYSKKVYTALKEINPSLASRGTNSIPENIVTLLFQYSFPTPICDLEVYIDDLILWFKDFLSE